MNQDPFKEYIKQSEPNKRDKGYAWSTAIGLQAVDGLEPSEQLVKTAIENIEGYITMEDAERRINSYYETISKKEEDDRTEEADKVSVRIASILSEKAFSSIISFIRFSSSLPSAASLRIEATAL